jgi:hypothetical protein
MLKQRRLAADQVAEALFAAEASLSRAMVDVADLVRATEAARTSANLSPVVSGDAVYRAISCLRGLGDANQELMMAHSAYAAVQKRIGLGAVSYGDDGAKPPGIDQTGPAIEAVAA